MRTELGQLKQFSELGVGGAAAAPAPMDAAIRQISQLSGKTPKEVAQYLDMAGIQTPDQLTRFIDEARPAAKSIRPLTTLPETKSKEQLAREYRAENLVPVGEALERFYPYKPTKYTEEEKGPGPIQPGRYQTGAYAPTGFTRRPPMRPFTPSGSTIEETRETVEQFRRQQSPPPISGGSAGPENIGDMTAIPSSNFRPELVRGSRSQVRQPRGWESIEPVPARWQFDPRGQALLSSPDTSSPAPPREVTPQDAAGRARLYDTYQRLRFLLQRAGEWSSQQ